MFMRSDRLGSLPSPAFIASVALLAANDFALKSLFHNALTGKLSDFAGLFALTLFVATLWPRHRRRAAFAIATAFTVWKTSYAEPVIEALNAVAPFTFGRTVDLTDLIAVPMIPLAAWAAPRLKPWPLPRVLQSVLAALAPLVFTATSLPQYHVRSTLDVSSAAVVDEAALQSFMDEVAEQHGLRCTVCESLEEGRVYSQASSERAPDVLTVNLDAERQQLFYVTSDYGRGGRAEVLGLSEDIRAAMQERFPGVTAIEFVEGLEALARRSTIFTIRLPMTALSVETAEQAKRTLSSNVEEVVRTHGLRADETALVYYAGRRFGASASERDLILVPEPVSNSTLRVVVTRQTDNYAALHEAINEDLAERLAAAFGEAAVAREDFQ
jgi:hypothetical protein